MESPDNHGFGWEYDTAGPRGLKLRWFAGVPPEVAAGFEVGAERVLSCMGVDAPVPHFVIITKADNFEAGKTGFYFPDPPLILLNDSAGSSAYWHEVVHYGLDYSTGDIGMNHACNKASDPACDDHTPQFREIEARCAA